jgi:hypothetical protein
VPVYPVILVPQIKETSFHLHNLKYKETFSGSTNQIRHSPLAAYFLHFTGLRKTPNKHIFTLKMATAMSVETLDNFQHSTLIILEPKIYIGNSLYDEWFLRKSMLDLNSQLTVWIPDTKIHSVLSETKQDDRQTGGGDLRFVQRTHKMTQ